jgi:hypothetical protein
VPLFSGEGVRVRLAGPGRPIPPNAAGRRRLEPGPRAGRARSGTSQRVLLGKLNVTFPRKRHCRVSAHPSSLQRAIHRLGIERPHANRWADSDEVTSPAAVDNGRSFADACMLGHRGGRVAQVECWNILDWQESICGSAQVTRPFHADTPRIRRGTRPLPRRSHRRSRGRSRRPIRNLPARPSRRTRHRPGSLP